MPAFYPTSDPTWILSVGIDGKWYYKTVTIVYTAKAGALWHGELIELEEIGHTMLDFVHEIRVQLAKNVH